MKQQEATPEQIDQYASKIKQYASKIKQYARKIEQYARTPGAAADEAERKRMGYELKQRLRNVSKLRQLIGTEERNMSDKTTKHEELKSVDMLKALDDAQVMHVRINSSNEIVIGESCDNYFEQTATPEQVRLMARQLKEIADEVERKAAQLEPYQQRMLDEHAELSDRISKLEAFTGTEAFEQLPELERCLMSHQLIDMHGYAGILRHRIRLWSKSDD